MVNLLSPPRCVAHRWERRLESDAGVETVVRVCERCGQKEVCWRSRSQFIMRRNDWDATRPLPKH